MNPAPPSILSTLAHAAAPRALAALLLASAAAAPAPAASPEVARSQVTVAAAASLKPALEELEAAFEAERPGVDVVVTFSASGTFFAQLQQGAPFDLFLSADRDYPQRLIAARLAAGPDVVYAVGRLVAWVPKRSPIDLERRGLAALAAPEVKHLAIANPAVAPWGRAAEGALRAAGLLEAVKDRIVLGQSVAQAAQFASTGAADAALLPRSLTSAPDLASGRTFEVPAALYPAQEQSATVIAAAAHPALARDLLAFATGPRGRAILAAHGFALP